MREDALEEFCVLSLQQGFIADFIQYFILVCVVGFLGSQSSHSCFLPTAAGLFVKLQDDVFWEVAV